MCGCWTWRCKSASSPRISFATMKSNVSIAFARQAGFGLFVCEMHVPADAIGAQQVDGLGR
jgi:hypothetical protein